MSTVEAVCVGETMALLLPGNAPFREATQFTLGQAGAESNVAVALARLGVTSAWVSRLGADEVGDRVCAALGAENVDLTGVVRSTSRPTGLFLKMPSGEKRKVVYYRQGSAASELARADVERAFDRMPRVAHFTGISPALSASCDDAIEFALREGRLRGIVTSFDVNYREVLWPSAAVASQRLAELAQLADVVFVGADEATLLWGTTSARDIAAHLAGAGTVVVKNAEIGATEISEGRESFERALRVDVVESVGAGDAFAGGWLAAYLRGADASVRLRSAHLMAASALRSNDDHGEALSWKHVSERAAHSELWQANEGDN